MAEESERKSAKQLLSRGKKAAGRRAGGRWSLFSSTTTMAPGSSTVSAAGPAPLISRSYSTTDVIEQVVTKQPQAILAPGGGVGARLSRKVKEQRARLYIARRCVSMLVCWRDADDS